jgi:hypothetical protein
VDVSTEQLTDEQVNAAWDEMAAEESPVDLGQVDSKQEEQPTELSDQANKPGQANKQPVAQPEDSKEVVDPYAGLPEVVKEKLGLVDKLQNDLKASNGRLASIQRDLDVAKQARLKTDDAPTEKAIEAAAKKSEKWEKLKEDFPEWAEAMDERLGSLALPRAIDPNQIQGLFGEQLVKAQQEFDQKIRAIQIERIEEKHEGWLETINTPDFAAWMNTQPAEIKALADSDKSRDAIKMLDLFEESRKRAFSANQTAIEQERQSRLDMAATRKGPSAPPPKGDEELTEDEIWNQEARRLERASQ